MGIFSKNRISKQEEVDGYMRALGLEKLDAESKKDVKTILNSLSGTGIMRAGMALSLANAADQVKVASLNALIQQNWLILKQLAELNSTIKMSSSERIPQAKEPVQQASLEDIQKAYSDASQWE